jgi:hypothetical protein
MGKSLIHWLAGLEPLEIKHLARGNTVQFTPGTHDTGVEHRRESAVVIEDDYFECKGCKRVAALPKENEDRTHCPLCGSDKGRVVPSAMARRLFALGIFSPPDSSDKSTKSKGTRHH